MLALFYRRGMLAGPSPGSRECVGVRVGSTRDGDGERLEARRAGVEVEEEVDARVAMDSWAHQPQLRLDIRPNNGTRGGAQEEERTEIGKAKVDRAVKGSRPQFDALSRELH